MSKKDDNLFMDAPIGGMKKIKPISGMKKIAPKIRWGDEYKSWTIEQRLKYAESLASTMNHAADILQQQCNKQADLIKDYERKLEHNANVYLQQGELMHKELSGQDAEKQKLYEEIVKIKAENRVLKKKLKEYEEGGS